MTHSLVSLKYAALKNLGAARAAASAAAASSAEGDGGVAAAQEALQAYVSAAAIDATDVVLWCAPFHS